MSVFPELESALDAAAHRRYRGRRRRVWVRWAAAPALAAGAAALVVALVPEREATGPAAPPPVTVPAAALARSDALVAAPAAPLNARTERLEHSELRAAAGEIAARVPYPPGAGESMDWEGTPPGPTDMASINDRGTVQFLVEFRAGCAWATFWLFALEQGNESALASATAVLQDVPHWPTLRASLQDPYERTQGWNAVAPAALARDAGPVRAYARANCAVVPTPWNDVIR
ncbi:hypothetical protein DVA67_030210 [Solirubrobacter sp. CPCC 204708]|uniref:DUF3105 domain-containing protein n=1 Tax=Solirubrobacter deserti TaxID=2282478 RepID=A0ABT4RIM5_9ACTN|nr:hypothetical protein [Solirubrobacter deserti]MBE2320279.1 hypothetical protein [Solirubrobacter deserti]MDA0138335.1 hypothetical protein [Solirubrobacter deserti]